MELLLLGMFVCSALAAFCGLECLFILTRPAETPETDAPPWADSPPEEDKKGEERRLRMDEGFENLMAYQVNLGRGRTTGGEA